LLLWAPEIPQIVVDHQAALGWPTERSGAVGQLVLAKPALRMVLHLEWSRLPHVYDGEAVEVR
jgi:hypothetical protein